MRYTLFVDCCDKRGYSKDYLSEQAARRKFCEKISTDGVFTLDGKPSPRAARFLPEHVWIKRYADKDEDGTVIADWRRTVR
jgi:hypothetical protein